MISMEKRYNHTCGACVFLGQYRKYDLYYCTGREQTPIARFGENGYYSSGILSWNNEPIRECIKRAADNNLIDIYDAGVQQLMSDNIEAHDYIMQSICNFIVKGANHEL